MRESIQDLGTAFRMLGELMRQCLDNLLDWEFSQPPKVGFTVAERFLIAVERARLENTTLLLTLDDGDLYDYLITNPETYVYPVSNQMGVVKTSFRGVSVNMSFREEDRVINEGF